MVILWCFLTIGSFEQFSFYSTSPCVVCPSTIDGRGAMRAIDNGRGGGVHKGRGRVRVVGEGLLGGRVIGMVAQHPRNLRKRPTKHIVLFQIHIGVVPPLGLLPDPSTLESVALTTSGPDVNQHGSLPQPTVTLPLLPPSSSTGPGRGPGDLIPSTMASGLTVPPFAADSTGMILSPALQPIPARLVRRILSTEFVEMRDLLSDNVSLYEQLESIHGPLHNAAFPGPMRARMREVPSLLSWVFCFAAYVAVRTSDPTTRDMLAYMQLITREGLRHGGRGWQDYDRSFRRQVAIDPSLRWNTLLPDLQASTVLGQGGGGGSYCSLCRGVDHTAARCALMYLQEPLSVPHMGIIPSAHTSAHRAVDIRYRGARASSRICTSWNRGTCAYPGMCNFRHVCALCYSTHRARDCPDAHNDSPFKTIARAAASTSAANGRR